MSCHKCTARSDVNLEDVLDSKEVPPLDSKYEILSRLGSGGNADVYEAINKENGNTVALKVSDRAFVIYNKRLFYNEIKGQLYLQTLPYIKDHIPHIKYVQYMLKYSPRQYMLIGYLVIEMDLIKGDTLNKYQGTTSLSINESISIFKQGLSFMNTLYNHGYVHNDIKPANMIYNKDKDHLYIIDYTLLCNYPCSRSCAEACLGEEVTPLYAHRTAIDNNSYNFFNADIWSFALTVLCTAVGGTIAWDETQAQNEKKYKQILARNLRNRTNIIKKYLDDLLIKDRNFANVLRSVLLNKGSDNPLDNVPGIDNIIVMLTNYKLYANKELIDMILFNAQHHDDKLEDIAKFIL